MATQNFKIVSEALESIRPYLKADGGDIKLIEVSNDFVVTVELMGACVDCSMSYQTMKNGVEQVVRKALPELKEVINKKTR